MPRKMRGSVYQTKDGVGIRWREGDRRRHRSGFRTEREARAWFALNVTTSDPLGAGCDEIRLWAQRHRAEEPDSWIYVVASHDAQRIKIGRTTKPDRRLRDLRTASPVTLTPLLWVAGGEKAEAALHHATRGFVVASAGSEWRTMDALEIVFAFVRERARTGIHHERLLGAYRVGDEVAMGENASDLVGIRESA